MCFTGTHRWARNARSGVVHHQQRFFLLPRSSAYSPTSHIRRQLGAATCCESLSLFRSSLLLFLCLFLCLFSFCFTGSLFCSFLLFCAHFLPLFFLLLLFLCCSSFPPPFFLSAHPAALRPSILNHFSHEPADTLLRGALWRWRRPLSGWPRAPHSSDARRCSQPMCVFLSPFSLASRSLSELSPDPFRVRISHSLGQPCGGWVWRHLCQRWAHKISQTLALSVLFLSRSLTSLLPSSCFVLIFLPREGKN